MKDLRPLRGKYYIADLIAEGEHEHQDFKFSIPDAPKIARSISAFANNDGGRLLIGVKDNGVIAGVRNEEDIYVVEQAALACCDPPQQVHFTSFRVDGGLIVIRVEIDRAATRPVMVKEPDGRRRAYYRVADENLPASELMVEAWRRAAADGGDSTIGEVETRLLGIVDNRSGLGIEDAMKALHISRHVAEEAVIKLYTAGLLDFAYISSGFRLVATGGF